MSIVTLWSFKVIHSGHRYELQGIYPLPISQCKTTTAKAAYAEGSIYNTGKEMQKEF